MTKEPRYQIVTPSRVRTEPMSVLELSTLHQLIGYVIAAHEAQIVSGNIECAGFRVELAN